MKGHIPFWGLSKSINAYRIARFGEGWGLPHFFSLTWAESSSELLWSPVIRRPSINFSHFHLLIENHGANSNQMLTKYPWVKWIQVCSSEGQRSFPRADNYKITKIHWRNLKIFFTRTAVPISTKFGSSILGWRLLKYRATPFSKAEIVKIYVRNLKIFLSIPTRPISTKLGTKHPRVMGIQVCSN